MSHEPAGFIPNDAWNQHYSQCEQHLRRIAREMHASDIDEAIADFRTDKLPGVARQYEPSKGSRRTLLGISFRNFLLSDLRKDNPVYFPRPLQDDDTFDVVILQLADPGEPGLSPDYELLHALAHCMNKLVPRDRRAVLDYYFLDYPLNAIAAQLGTPSKGLATAGAEQRMRRIRGALRACLQRRIHGKQ